MNRTHLLDSLDGFKALIFRLLPVEVVRSIACVPMTTDGLWTSSEKRVFENVIGIPGERTFWEPGSLVNVPPANSADRVGWISAVAAINPRYLFLDPDMGFYTHHTDESEKMVLVEELKVLLLRHQYWPHRLDDVPEGVYPYVWHGLRTLRTEGLFAFAYQSLAASLFFISGQQAGIEPFYDGFRHAMPETLLRRRLVKV